MLLRYGAMRSLKLIWFVVLVLFASPSFSADELSQPLLKQGAPLREKVMELHRLIRDKSSKGRDVSEALALDRMSKQAVEKGDIKGATEYLDRAIGALKGSSSETPASSQVSGPRDRMKEASPRTIELPVGADKVFVTRSVPEVERRSNLKGKDFTTETLQVEGGKIALTVDWIPIYIEEKKSTGRGQADPDLSPFGFHPAYTYESIMDRQKLRKPSEVGYNYSTPTDMGVVWNRPEYYALWGKIQKDDSDISEGKFDWKESDYVYGSVPKHMRTMANIGGIQRRTKQGEKPFPRTFTFKSDFYENNFAIFVKKLVERYNGDGVDDMTGLKSPVKYWQIENEPDLATNDWKGYAKLVADAGKAVKEACPDCKVVMGGLSIPQSLNSFYIPVMRELQGKYVDVFDFHQFGQFGAWESYQRLYDSIRKALDSNGFGGAEVWITETGTYTGSPKVYSKGPNGPVVKMMPNQSERQQAAEVVKRYVFGLSLGIKKVFWAFGIMEGLTDSDGEFDHTGFIYDGNFGGDPGRGVKKLSYYTYKYMTEKLGGCDLSQIKRLELGTGVYAYKFMKYGRPVYVIWAGPIEQGARRSEGVGYVR